MKSPYQSSSSVKWNCMQGQDDDASSLQDNHAPWSTPDKKRRNSSGQLLLAELWRGTLAWSNNENHLKKLDPCQVLQKSYCSCRLHLEVTKENSWARLPYCGYKAQNQHTRRCTWIHQKSCCTDSWTRPYLVVTFMDNTFLFIRGVFSRT